MTLEEPRQGGRRYLEAAHGQTRLQLLEALVGLFLERRHHMGALCLDGPGPRVAALRLRLAAPGLAPGVRPRCSNPWRSRASPQRITEDAETPNRSAAPRRLHPSSTTASARVLRSMDSGLPIPLPRYLPRDHRTYGPPRLQG
jgi:hypothetical protein